MTDTKKEYPVAMGSEYILQGVSPGNRNSVDKVFVEDVTETTVFLIYTDTDGSRRMTWREFENNYEVIEELRTLLPMEELFNTLAELQEVETISNLKEDQKVAMSNGSKTIRIAGESFEGRKEFEKMVIIPILEAIGGCGCEE